MNYLLVARALIAMLLCIVSSIYAGDDAQVPKHLALGRTLISSLAPENTSYRHQGYVRWKGDLFTPDYEAHTDCSGLINSLLTRADCSTMHHLMLATARGRHPKAEDYFNLILKQDGFRKIDAVADVLPGDIIAVKYHVGARGQCSSCENSGHVMMVDDVPTLRKKDTTPIVSGTKQWEVLIIDSTMGSHGMNDTRYRKNGSKIGGVGSGILRLYSDADGKIIGYSWSTLEKTIYHSSTSRPLVVGRVLCYASTAAVGKDIVPAGSNR
jgi:hypothetical protein